MNPENKVFGRGPRELTGSVDLLNHYGLLPHYDFFCKRPLSVSISDTYYLHGLVGEMEIRKGEGMELGQLIENGSLLKEINSHIQSFDLYNLWEAFQLRDTSPVFLPSCEKGTPTIASKSKSESKDKEKRHKKHTEKDKEREHKKHKHRHKDRSKERDKDKKKDKGGGNHDPNIVQSKRHHEKKRKSDGDEDGSDMPKHRKSKHKSAKVDEIGAN